MKKITTALLAATALFASSGAMAQAYVGGSLGWSDIDVDCGGFASCDTSDVGFKLFGGYKFTPYVAVEASYVDYGKATASAGPVSVDLTGTSFGVGVAGFLPFNNVLTGVGRLGLASNKAKLSGPGFSSSDTNTKPYFGIALDFRVMPQLHIEGGLDFTTFEEDGDEADVRLLSVGVRYEF